MKKTFLTTLLIVGTVAGIYAVLYFIISDSERTTKASDVLYQIPRTTYPDFNNIKHSPELISLLISKIKSHPEDWEFKDGASSYMSSIATLSYPNPDSLINRKCNIIIVENQFYTYLAKPDSIFLHPSEVDSLGRVINQYIINPIEVKKQREAQRKHNQKVNNVINKIKDCNTSQ